MQVRIVLEHVILVGGGLVVIQNFREHVDGLLGLYLTRFISPIFVATLSRFLIMTVLVCLLNIVRVGPVLSGVEMMEVDFWRLSRRVIKNP